MDWYKFEEYLTDYHEWLSLDTVHFGCDCGCGGDSYTEYEWDNIEFNGRKAMGKLKALGITGMPYDFD